MDVGRVLPWLQGVTDDRGRPLNWRDTRYNRVAFFSHPVGCQGCVTYGTALLDLHGPLMAWDGRLWLIGDGIDDATPPPDDVARVTGAHDRGLRERCAVAVDEAMVLVADRWGQVWQTAPADDDHVLVDPTEVLETAKFIALQCPECETLDQPAGDWSSVR